MMLNRACVDNERSMMFIVRLTAAIDGPPILPLRSTTNIISIGRAVSCVKGSCEGQKVNCMKYVCSELRGVPCGELVHGELHIKARGECGSAVSTLTTK